MNKSSYGFTLIELLVTFVVIGILSGLAVVGFSSIQRSTRDSARESQATIIAEAMESYYLKNGEYPTCSQMTAAPATIAANVLPGIDSKVFRTPKAIAGVENSIVCSAPSGDADVYIYAAASDGLSWTLSYKSEAEGTIKSVSSRQVIASVPAGDPDPDPDPDPNPGENVSAYIPFTLAQIESICTQPGTAVSGYNQLTFSGSGSFNGTSGNDVMWRTGGLGSLDSGGGNDIACITYTGFSNTGSRSGGEGHDVIFATGGTGSLNGGNGNDVIISQGSHTGSLEGNDGDDTFYINSNVGSVKGGAGYDRATVLGGSAVIGSFESIEEIF